MSTGLGALQAPRSLWLAPALLFQRASMLAHHPNPTIAPRYRILRLIKRGGMAEVYEGVLIGESGFERRVAIKMPLGIYGDLDIEAFGDEARILSRLNHPGIVGVFELGMFDGKPFQALELVDGVDLFELSSLAAEEKTPMSTATALFVIAEVADALHYAHEACDAAGEPLHIVHRDVTPQNILISWNAEVKLADFGIAVATIRRIATRPGVVKGKLAFMAPEQIAGDALSRKADIFSLGCVLHYILTGASPFHAIEARARAQRGTSPRLAEGLDEDVAQIVRRAIAHETGRRFTTARELGLACRAAMRQHGDTSRDELVSWLDRLKQRRKSLISEMFNLDDGSKARFTRELPHGPITVLETGGFAEFDDSPPTEYAPMRPSIAQCGRFEILESLPGQGEMFLARSLDPGPSSTRAVVKVLPRELALDANMAASFFADASLLSRVGDEHVLGVLAYGAEKDRLFVALEHAQGRTLRELLLDVTRVSPTLDLAQIVAIGAGIARGIGALAAARRASLSQRLYPVRDIRPETVLITYDGGVKLADFAFSASSGEVSAEPERLELFALGNCLYEMLTGHRWSGEQAGEQDETRPEQIQSPTAVRGNEEPAIDAIIFALLDPKEGDPLAIAELLSAVGQSRRDLPSRTILLTLMRELYGKRARPVELRRPQDEARTMLADPRPRSPQATRVERSPRPMLPPPSPRPTSSVEELRPRMRVHLWGAAFLFAMLLGVAATFFQP